MDPRTTKVVHVQDGCDFYIGRAMPGYPASEFANPMRVGRDGTREEVIDWYRNYITERLSNEPALQESLERYRGKRIGCWCKPERGVQLPCHGDVLVDILEGPAPPSPEQFALF